MKEIKKYMDIIRCGHPSTQGVFKEGDVISITEKNRWCFKLIY